MAGIDGAATKIAYVNSLSGSTYGTALDVTSYTDAKICASITENFSVDEVLDDGIGCGSNVGFVKDVRAGLIQYGFGLSGNMGFQNGFDRILAQFFGSESAPAEQTVGEDDWLHVFKFATLSNQRWGTLVYETGSASVMEGISTYTQRIQISMSAVKGYITWSADLLANAIAFTNGTNSPVNTTADLSALALLDSELVFAECTHTFRMKAVDDDGADTALGSGDKFAITSFDLEMETPLEIIPELTGGNCAAPSQSDRRNGTLTIGIKQHSDNTNTYVPWEAGTSFMCDIEWKGKQINAGVQKSVKIRIPKMKLVNSPGYSITNAGKNPVTLAFRLLESENTMPGFSSKGPEVAIINKKDSVYLA